MSKGKKKMEMKIKPIWIILCGLFLALFVVVIYNLLKKKEHITGSFPDMALHKVKDSDGDVHNFFTWNNPKDIVSQPFFEGNFWEPFLQPLIKTAMKNATETSVSLDIGANIGAHSVYMNKFGNVWCFEPQKETFRILQSNLDNAQKHRKLTKAFNFALGENFSNDFRMGDVPKDNNGATMISQTSTGEPITVYRLDAIWKEHGQPRIDLIKIDVEGHELECFLSGLEVLKRNRPFIIFVDWLVQKGDYTVFNFLRELGYVIKEVHPPNDFFAFPIEKEEDYFKKFKSV